jgi:acyl carrier protein
VRIHEGTIVTTSPPTVLTDIITILQREFPTLRKTALTADTPLLSAGLLDSFAVVTLIASLEEAFGIDIDVEATGLEQFESPGTMATLCTACMASSSSSAASGKSAGG